MGKIPFYFIEITFMETVTNLKTTISSFWKEYLIKYTGATDVAKVSDEFDIGYWTLNKIRQGAGNVANIKNHKAIEALIHKAVNNAETQRNEIDEDIKKMKGFISEILDCI